MTNGFRNLGFEIENSNSRSESYKMTYTLKLGEAISENTCMNKK